MSENLHETPGKQTRAEASRANGAKSRGPVTPEGKARSSMNGFKHGLRSGRVVLPTEGFDIYSGYLQAYMDVWLPQNIFEQDLVENMVNARWRIRRIESMETCAINATIVENNEATRQKFSECDINSETALAFRAFANAEKALETFSRHEERLQKTFERSYKLLERSRAKANLFIPSTEDAGNIEAEYPANSPQTPSSGEPIASEPSQSPSSPPPPPPPPRNPPVDAAAGPSHLDSFTGTLVLVFVTLLLAIQRPEIRPVSPQPALIQPAKRVSSLPRSPASQKNSPLVSNNLHKHLKNI
jgi:hypothetical protein